MEKKSICYNLNFLKFTCSKGFKEIYMQAFVAAFLELVLLD